MTRIDKLILGLASGAALGAFLLQCPTQTGGAFCLEYAVPPRTLAGSAVVLPALTLAACSFAAMLVSTALHHMAGRHDAAVPARSLAAELAWTMIPIMIIVGVALRAIGLPVA